MFGCPVSLKCYSLSPASAAIERHSEEIESIDGNKVDSSARVDQDCVFHSSGNKDQVAFGIAVELPG